MPLTAAARLRHIGFRVGLAILCLPGVATALLLLVVVVNVVQAVLDR